MQNYHVNVWIQVHVDERNWKRIKEMKKKEYNPCQVALISSRVG